MALHGNEFRVDKVIVRQLLAEQMPQWSGFPLQHVPSAGTVNVLYRLGDDMVVRLPRSPDFTGGPLREAALLPRFRGDLPLRIPEHLALGSPNAEYPSHWSVVSWIEGETADRNSLSDLDSAARELAQFVRTLREQPTDDAPAAGSYRGGPLASMDGDFRKWDLQLPDDIDRSKVIDIWESCLQADGYQGPAVWLHSDLRGDNLLTSNGHLSAVIDWEGCTVGDPSADLVSAWWLFDSVSRETFRTAADANESEWRRAKGWALHMAVAAIPYYEHTNRPFANQARTALQELISDSAT